MLLTVGLRETCPKNVRPNYVERPMSCATFPILEGFFIDPPYPMVSVTGLPRRALRRLRHGLDLYLEAARIGRRLLERRARDARSFGELPSFPNDKELSPCPHSHHTSSSPSSSSSWPC